MTTTDAVDIDTGTSELLCSVRGRVAVVTLNRPEARNARSNQLTPALRRIVKRCADDPDIGALLITGAGTAFCAGGDVKIMARRSGQPRSREERVADLRLKQRTLTGALVGLRKPTIAALPGPAAGAGLAIALACGIRIAAESAFVTTAYVRIGFSGDYGINWLLTRAVGSAREKELMFFSERIDAARCERIGLVNRVVPDGSLQRDAFAAARLLANGPATAFALIKDNLDDALSVDLATALDREADRMIAAGQSRDHKKSLHAFVESHVPKSSLC
ncbi:MAG: enoyl-CoA hydratase-related protein [Alphaproteobacteria bacterium]|nr:enoyl-CoA hydratase-related protein [Alphaproteobacteria bacterium]